MEYRLYIFLTNYRLMRDVYKKDIDILFENISSYLESELESISGKVERSDYKSMLVKSSVSNDFATILRLAGECGILISRIRSLMKDFRTSVPVKIGVITADEKDKRHPFKWNLPSEDMDQLPDVLLSDRTSVSVIENYEIKACGLKNIWTTTGVEISRSKKIRNIYFNRDEEDTVEEFISGNIEEKVLYVWGEKGSGKSGIIREVLSRTDSTGIIHIREKKHSTREFKIIHDLMYNLLFIKRHGELGGIDDVTGRISNSILPAMNKANLTYFVNLIFGDMEPEETLLFEYGDYRTSLKKALTDCLKLNQDPFTIIIDDHQWVSANCEKMLFEIVASAQDRLRLILCSDDKNNSNNIQLPVKYLHISDMNKVQISKMLQMLFLRMKIAGKTADFIHKATGGNLYTVIEFIQYLTNKEYFSVADNKVCINYPDLKNIPDNLTDMYHEKIASLSKNASDILKIISVMGDDFYPSDLDWLLHVINYPGDERDAIKELEDRGIIINEGDHYTVSEISVITEVYRSVNEKNRKLIHGLLGELFETKGFEKFGFKVFLHYYKAENNEKLISLLPELISDAHKGIQFLAMRNMLEIADKLLFRMCIKEAVCPVDRWLFNLKQTKYLFDAGDPLDTVKRFEKAIDHLIKIEKSEYSPDLFVILLKCYIASGKSKKSSQYIKTGLEIAEKLQLTSVKLNISVLDMIMKLDSGKPGSAVRDFAEIEAAASELPEVTGTDDYKYLKARVSLIANDTETAQELLTGLLDKYTSELNFARTGEITGLMVEISLKKRDHKAAEDYCKYILGSEKSSGSGSDATVATNILIARLYGYQNKFLQSVSLLESLAETTRKRELKSEIFYELGSLYQFYGEKELALKTFENAIQKIKPAVKGKDPVFELKIALVLASLEEYEEAAEHIRKCVSGKNELCRMLNSVIRFITKKEPDGTAEQLIGTVKDSKAENTDIVFETGLLLFNNLTTRRKFSLCKVLSGILSEMTERVRDYNLVLEFNKAGKSILRISAKGKKKAADIKKVMPSVRKRVKNRRNS